MILYSYWRSTTSFRVRAALNLKKVDYTLVSVDLVAGEQHGDVYRAVNPGYGVPALQLNDGTVLTQSLAIIDYLDATFPEPPMVSSDPALRAKQLAAALTVATDVHPVNNLRVLSRLEGQFGANADDKVSWMRHWMAEGFSALEALLPGGVEYAFGNTPDLADICIVVQCVNAHRFGLSLDPYPKVARIEANCLAVPEIAAAAPDAQPEAEKS
ncbi:maleylacetoacetate isomerase [Gymnodinialimonas hymeniacidonis]|uniref:maleylacetoacetate isomerase n=1 Tax=Gymnodinialimonas hymeniacidonis TaxID=3126508 RepID=UPI0034C62E23